MVKQLKLQFLRGNLFKHRSEPDSQLLSVYCSSLCINPLLWLLMTHIERSRWRLGWLPGGISKLCPRHPHQQLTKSYSIHCLNMDQYLQIRTAM